MYANELITRAGHLLHDTAGVRWGSTQLLLWLNDGQKQIVVHRPDASIHNGSIGLTSGTTQQALPSGALRLISVSRNMGTGSTPGRPVTLVDKDILDAQIPDWHTSDVTDEIEHYIYDIKNPKIFHVYPRPASSVYIAVAYSVLPDDCGSTSSSITLPDIYSNALLDYIIYRALSSDTEFADQPRANNHYNSFLNSLGLKLQVDQALDPNTDKKHRG